MTSCHLATTRTRTVIAAMSHQVTTQDNTADQTSSQEKKVAPPGGPGEDSVSPSWKGRASANSFASASPAINRNGTAAPLQRRVRSSSCSGPFEAARTIFP